MNKIDGLSIHDLRAVALLADTRHFGKTAEILGVAQPSITAIVQKVETILGETLFHRTSRSCQVTPAGAQALEIFQEILNQSEKLRTKDQSNTLTGQFNMGVIPTIAPFAFPQIVTSILNHYPNLKLLAIESKTNELVDLVRTHQIDAAIVSTVQTAPDLRSINIGQEELFLIAPKNHAITKLTPIGSENLNPADMLLLDQGNCLRDQITSTCTLQSQPNSISQSNSLFSIAQFVNMGYGYSLIPKMALSTIQNLPNIIVKSLNPPATRPLNLLVRSRDVRVEAITQLANICRIALTN